MKPLLFLIAMTASASLLAGPLHEACRSGNLEAVKKALEAEPGALNELDKSTKLTPLMVAVRTNAVPAAEFLIKKGADLKAKGFMGTQALHSAAVKHSVEALKLLLDNGADVNARDEGGATPAHYAGGRLGPRRQEALDLLAKYKADFSLKDKEGQPIPR
jgi:ankyrin repeat protein